LLCVYGGGLVTLELLQSVTIADSGDGSAGASTTAATSTRLEVTCNDADGCNYNPSSCSVTGGLLVIANVGAANTITVDSAGGAVTAAADKMVFCYCDSSTSLRCNGG
jgi:hypothetical protein